MTPDLSALAGAVGRREIRSGSVSKALLRRFSLALGGRDAAEDAPALLAHWAAFADATPSSGLGPDGHPLQDSLSVIPPIPLPRRMFAGAEVALERPLALEAPARLETEVVEVRQRQGRQGPLVFIDLERRLVQEDQTALRERQTLVYRDGGGPALPVGAAPEAPAGDEIWTPTEVELFRFSAATFNSHRIHYDLAYAREIEGYPERVVHGPLTAARLLLLARRRCGRGEPTGFRFRAEAPLFLGAPIALRSDPDTGAAEAVRADGVVAVRAEVLFPDRSPGGV